MSQGIPPGPHKALIADAPPKPLKPGGILLRERGATSCAQFARAVVVGGVFALILVWILPSRPVGAAPAPMAVASNPS
jgi:hypothetical protein